MSRIHTAVFILVAIIALALGFTVYKVLNTQAQNDPAALMDAGIVLLPQSRTLPALSLTNQDDQTVAVNQLTGQWSLLFFGYTFCPDICPATLSQLRQLLEQLPPEVIGQLQVVLVSVDPNRDTPQQLKHYLGYFDTGFVGLTGAPESIQTLATALSIPFVPADTSKENYTVEHSGNLALIGPDGKQRGFIRAPINNAKLAEQLPKLLAPTP